MSIGDAAASGGLFEAIMMNDTFIQAVKNRDYPYLNEAVSSGQTLNVIWKQWQVSSARCHRKA